MGSFDVEACRKRFPALQDSTHIYLDNAGGSQCLGDVIDDVKAYLTGTNVQLGGSYDIGIKSNELYAKGFQAAARYINAEAGEVVIGASTTQLYRNLSWSFEWEQGDEIVLSPTNHEANLASWISIAEEKSLKVIWWEPKSSMNPQLRAAELKQYLTARTKFVAIPHVSNVLGTINDVKGIANVVHETCPEAKICVDGVAYAPHAQIDVKDLGVDFYAFSWYKVYGPHIALLFAKSSAQENMKSLGHFFKPTATLEDKLGLAGASYELTATLPRILDYLGGSNPASFFDPTAEHEQRLQQKLIDFLLARPEITVIGERSGDRKVRVPTISFVVSDTSSRVFVERADKIRPQGKQVGIRWGHFYAKRLCDNVLKVGEDGVVRVSMVHYNTEEEVDQLIFVLKAVLADSSQDIN